MRPLPVAAAGALALLLALPALAVSPAALDPVPSQGADDAAWVRIADAMPATHEPLVPVMRQFAQGVPLGIRPGAWMDQPHACTMAFVVQDETGDLYITTAGHCVDRVGQEVEVVGHGTIGTVITYENRGIGRDWALIRLDPAKYAEVTPRMAAWGGPTGMYAGGASGALVTKHYGFGALTWYTHETRCRAALAQASQFSSTHFEMTAVLIWGDSGSPTVLEDGRALGINTHLKLFDADNAAGTRLDHALRLAGQRTGHTYTVVTGGNVELVCADT